MEGSVQLLVVCAALALTVVARSFVVAQQEEAMYQRPKLTAKGRVFCDQCGQGLQSNKTLPLQDVEVSIKCRDLYGFVTFSAIGWTDEHGAFTIPVDNIPFISGIAGCQAKLVRSMNEHCNSTTNLGGGQEGAPLFLKSKSFELVVLTAGPFAYSPSSRLPTCARSPYPSHSPSLHHVGNPYYASPPPPPPVSRATYLYTSPPPPSLHLPPHFCPLRPAPPQPPPPLSPPPPPYGVYFSPPPSPPPIPTPISYTHHYRYHHHHHAPLPPPYYHSSSSPPPLYHPPLPPKH